ncbi:ap2-like ethylene-responsive transcription factor plt2 [Phtheirospermum japonicum]|uniref:Ap2-like ethylene-responsive transcription factor plt2 n=1 Tax=Phtheirospermum japonicum TaxID=374723 RepID=A0A830CFG1_9LAMI|nr:ap2-like ethylene-responsive transcription factor plt2 [Phtheirospermum japonicum]
MIKNWLRNNPAAAPHAVENKAGDEVAAPPPPAAGAQSLSLSMSTGSQSSTALPLLSGGATESCTSEYNKVQQCSGGAAVDGGQAGGAVESTPRKSIETFGQRTSIYRGIDGLADMRHIYGIIVAEEKDKPGKEGKMSNYEKEIEEMKHMTRQEYVASLRRKSSGFSRGASIYRGVTRHHQHGRWQARIGRVAGNKDLYLGTFSTQEEAAEAYDIAAIKFRGLNAVTNFEINRYDVKSILESTTLPIGGAAKRLKDAENAEMALELHRANEANNLNLHLLTDHSHGHIINNNNNNNTHNWPTIAFQQPQPLMSISNYPFALHQRSLWCKQEQDPDVINHGYNENTNINHHLQLGNTHNFFQPNITSLDSDHGVGPMMGPAVFVQDGQHQENGGGFTVGYDQCMFGSTDARNLYCHQFQQSSAGLEKAGIYDQESGCNNNDWNNIPTAVPTVAARSNNGVAVCHGASTFTVWNDT